MSDSWQALEDPDLAALSNRLDQDFAVERALLPAGLAENVRSALPVKATPLLRAARALTGVILVAAAGCVAMAVALVTAPGASTALVSVRLITGLSAVFVAVLLTLAAPRLLAWDASVLKRLTGKVVRPGPMDLVLVRAGALFMLLVGGVVMAG